MRFLPANLKWRTVAISNTNIFRLHGSWYKDATRPQGDAHVTKDGTGRAKFIAYILKIQHDGSCHIEFRKM